MICNSYYYIDYKKKKHVVLKDTYYLLEKNTNQKNILKQLQLNDIFIQYLDWRIISLISNDIFIPKAGEYLIPKNSSIQDIQNIFQNEKTITRNFKLIEGTTSNNLKKSLLENQYLSGEIKVLKEGVYKVVIRGTLEPGFLTYGEVIIPSTIETEEEIFFSNKSSL